MQKSFKESQYGFMLLAQGFVFFMTPFARGLPALYLLFILGLFGVSGAVILTIWKSRLPRFLAISSALVTLVTGLLAFHSLQFDQPVVPYLVACCASYALFVLVAIVSVGLDVLVRDRITLDCILGSICLYLLLGIFFGFVFGLISLLLPNCFAVAGGSMGNTTLNDLLYFSFATLTTTGYGDISPLHPLVRTIALLESVSGTLYIAVMITRLVSLHVAEKGSARRDP